MLNVLDLFSGIGGFSLGLERTGGFRTVAFCEIEEFPRRVLRKHWPNVPIFEDIRELKGEDITEQVDVITGGFPCQDISIAGRRAGIAGERSGLFWELVRALRVVRPRLAVLENVAALLDRDMGEVCGALAEVGYDTEWDCIPAASVGAPHIRDRVWIVCSDTNRSRLERPFTSRLPVGRVKRAALAELGNTKLSVGAWWQEHGPYLRVGNGLSREVDELKALGNAVVPQVVERIGEAILKAEEHKGNNA